MAGCRELMVEVDIPDDEWGRLRLSHLLCAAAPPSVGSWAERHGLAGVDTSAVGGSAAGPSGL